jgi:hypothetical protein
MFIDFLAFFPTIDRTLLSIVLRLPPDFTLTEKFHNTATLIDNFVSFIHQIVLIVCHISYSSVVFTSDGIDFHTQKEKSGAQNCSFHAPNTERVSIENDEVS